MYWRFVDVKYYIKNVDKNGDGRIEKAYGSLLRYQLRKDNLANKVITFDKIRLQKSIKKILNRKIIK